MFDTGPAAVKVVGGPASFFDNYQTTTLYVERVFGGSVNTVTVSNDSTTDTIYISFNGATVDGSLTPGESITLNTATLSSVFIRGTAGGGYVRIWGW
jgi:hypothetical protein